MRIDNWPMERIMRLPDWCFGRKWAMGEALTVDPEATGFVISQDGLPEVCVIWEVWGQISAPTWGIGSVEFRIGNQLPANLAEFRQLEPLFGPVGEIGIVRSTFITGSMGDFRVLGIKQKVEAGGRNLVMRMEQRSTTAGIIQAGIVVSSIPKEVPDWLISAKAINL